jgi:hypothetical protein
MTTRARDRPRMYAESGESAGAWAWNGRCSSCNPMVTWTQFGAYVSVATTVFAGGVGLCWLVLWRQ